MNKIFEIFIINVSIILSNYLNTVNDNLIMLDIINLTL